MAQLLGRMLLPWDQAPDFTTADFDCERSTHRCRCPIAAPPPSPRPTPHAPTPPRSHAAAPPPPLAAPCDRPTFVLVLMHRLLRGRSSGQPTAPGIRQLCARGAARALWHRRRGQGAALVRVSWMGPHLEVTGRSLVTPPPPHPSHTHTGHTRTPVTIASTSAVCSCVRPRNTPCHHRPRALLQAS